MSEDPPVVVVVTHNSAEVVGDLLDTVPKALDGLRAEVVVVDNASTDRTRDVLRLRDDCALVTAPNRGYAAGLNSGVASSGARGPIVILNPDVRLEPGCLLRLVCRLDEPGVGIVVPLLRGVDGVLAPSIRREPTLLRSLGLGFTGLPRLSEPDNTVVSHERGGEVDWATGAVMVISRDCYDTVGGWDESFFLYSEETDFCLRARDAGFRTVLEPGAVALHIGGQSGTSARTYSMQILNRVRLYARRHGPVAAWAFYVMAVVRESAHAARGRPDARAALQSLLVPASRPAELGCSRRLLPD